MIKEFIEGNIFMVESQEVTSGYQNNNTFKFMSEDINGLLIGYIPEAEILQSHIKGCIPAFTSGFVPCIPL